MRRAEARGRGVVARAGAIETIGEFADRAQAVTANAHAALVTSKVFEVADAAATTDSDSDSAATATATATCRRAREAYERACPRSWVTHFESARAEEAKLRAVLDKGAGTRDA